MDKIQPITNDITVIIPVHELDNTSSDLLRNALKSVGTQQVQPKLLVVTTSNLVKEVEEMVQSEYGISGYKVVQNNGATDFASQINFGVSQIDTEWFCLLEYDDELSSTWIKNAIKYKEVYTDVDMFLPIVTDVNSENGFLGFSNEAVWAAEFSDELGILDNNALLGYQNFNFDGMVMRRETYEANGGIKPSMKLTFIYEFLLRMTYFSTRVMVIPKLGYKHVNQRTGGLFNSYKSTLSPDEARWWMSLAKKEYFHTKDRGITYEKETA